MEHDAGSPGLAYVFWHAPNDAADVGQYEAGLQAFHRALAGEPPSGFVRSWSVRCSPVPWLAGAARAYADWYLVEDFGALGRLNAAAVSGGRQEAHDRVARWAAAGTAGLYRAVGDGAGPPETDPVVEHWVAKPAGVDYAAWQGALAGLRPPLSSVWQRQMTLGPTPEFCLVSAAVAALPWPALPVTVHRLPAADGDPAGRRPPAADAAMPE